MNDKKIAFIICVNNEIYFEECCWYLNQLVVPDGFETDIIAVREAKSAAEAYNAAMDSTDAKYKIYMHQDVFIYNFNFISDVVGLFQAEKKIGMIGLIGGVKLPESGIVYNAWNCGRAITCDWILTVDICFYQKDPYCCVEALDGMLLATQYDIPWREDIFKNWHYYDISQSFEFIRAGYCLAIPFQEKPWVIHDCGYSNLNHYHEARNIILRSYPEFFKRITEEDPLTFNYELMHLTNQLYQEITKLIDNGSYQEAESILEQFEENGMNKYILILRYVFQIIKIEKKSNLKSFYLQYTPSTEEMLNRYTVIKYFLRRLELTNNYTSQEIMNWINLNQVSVVECIMVTINNIFSRKAVLKLLREAYINSDAQSNAILFDNTIEILDKDMSRSFKNNEVILKRRKEAECWTNHKELF